MSMRNIIAFAGLLGFTTIGCSSSKSSNSNDMAPGTGNGSGGSGASGRGGSLSPHGSGGSDAGGGTGGSGTGTSGGGGSSGHASGSGGSSMMPSATDEDGGEANVSGDGSTMPREMTPIDAPVTDDCITDVSAGDHSFTCSGLTFLVMVDAMCTKYACGMIFDIHGATMSGAQMRDNTHLQELAPPMGYLTVHPSATSANTGGTWDLTNDPPKVADFMTRMIKAFHVDPGRVHVTGFSQGGAMTWWFLCNHNDLLASTGPVAGALNTMPCMDKTWKPRVPILNMNGINDLASTIDNSRTRFIVELSLTRRTRSRRRTARSPDIARATHASSCLGRLGEQIRQVGARRAQGKESEMPNSTRSTVSPTHQNGSWARYASLALGIWLFISAFLWPHAPALRTDTWILGVIISVVSIAAMRSDQVRWVHTVAAIWLFVSTLAMTHFKAGTAWSNLLVAIAVFLLSLVPNHGYSARAHA